jgi:hypothetical protein
MPFSLIPKLKRKATVSDSFIWKNWTLTWPSGLCLSIGISVTIYRTQKKPSKNLRSAYDEIINTSRVVIYDHFGSNEIDGIVAKVRHMAALGCKYIVLDHLEHHRL